jgi:hypothetical protein
MKNKIFNMRKIGKKADLSINIIIIAAIALIVLVVLIAVFTGRMTVFGFKLDILQKGSKCPNSNWKTTCDATSEKVLYGNFEDSKDNPGKQCCVPLS